MNKLKTWEEINGFIKSNPLKNVSDLCNLIDCIDLDSVELQQYTIKIKGAPFSSSITSGFAQSLLDTQQAFNRVLASFEAGRVVQRVPNNKYHQLVFTFDKGCTEIKIKVLELIAGIFKSVENMSDRKVLIVGVITLLCFSGHNLVKLYQTDRNLQQNHELLDLLQDKKLLYGLQSAEVSGNDVKLSFAKQAPAQFTEGLSFNGNTVSKEEIASIQNKEANNEAVIKTVTDDFLIIDINGKTLDKMQLVAVCQSTRVRLKAFRPPVEMDLFESEQDPDEPQLSDDDLDRLWDALKKNQSIKLQVRMEFSNGKMKSGTILAIY